jgi:arylformamidase
LIFLHGGYWRALDKEDFSWVAPAYVQAGTAVAVVNYGLMPATPLPEIVRQIRRACIWLYDNAMALGIDSQRIVCSGHSAGAHLTAMMLATDWPRVAARLPRRLLSAAISISGVFDLAPLSRAPFLREDLALDEAAVRALSPIHLQLSNDVPLLRVVGALESDEFHRQSHLITQAWPTVCAAAPMSVPGTDHMSVCEAFATRDSALFQAARALVG